MTSQACCRVCQNVRRQRRVIELMMGPTGNEIVPMKQTGKMSERARALSSCSHTYIHRSIHVQSTTTFVMSAPMITTALTIEDCAPL